MKKIKLMLIEDEEFDKIRVEKTLQTIPNKFEISHFVSDGRTAIEKLKNNPNSVDVVIMDFQIAGGIMGEALIKRIKEVNSLIQIIVISKMTMNITDFDFANSLISAGAFWYCTKYPADIREYIYQPTDFILSIFNAYEKKLLEEEKVNSNIKLQIGVDRVLEKSRIIGSSSKINELKEEIEKYAVSKASVLITGPSGSGKELVATALHYKSERKFENFITVNCSSIPFELIESELFGYEKGAFTGADKNKKGLFEQADKGTIFLDEVGELPLAAQAKLLRVLEAGEIEKIGRTGKSIVDVRVIAATNKDLKQGVDDKKFRADLYYRLNIIPISVPNLKDRTEDIQELFDFFLEKYSKSHGINKPKVLKDVYGVLNNHKWEGNIRELNSVAQRIVLSRVDVVDIITIYKALGTFEIEANQISKDFKNVFDSKNILSLKEFKKVIYTEYIKFVKNNSESDAETAKKLGIAQSNFHRLCVELGLK